jgi:ABC-2 type transport system ATP-binding protein
LSDPAVLKVSGLSKYFVNGFLWGAQKVIAVDCLDFCLERGEIFSLLGPNGAGKTTTLNMLVGIMRPSSGSIDIFGSPFFPGKIAPLSKIGYVPEATSLPGYFTISELLDFYGQLFSMAASLRVDRIKHLLEMVGLVRERNCLIRNLSMGQRRLVDIMQALINDPDLILLDEPTVYLDPVIIERLRSILLGLKKEGKAIVVSSHMLSEIEKISDRVAIINHGKLMKVGPKEDFLRSGTMEEEFLRIVKHVD